VIAGTATVASGGEVLITFNNNATNDVVNGVMQSITYENTVNSPSDTIELEWHFDDGNVLAQGDGGAESTTGILSVGFLESPVVVVNELDVDENSTNGTSVGLVIPNDSPAIAALLNLPMRTHLH